MTYVYDHKEEDEEDAEPIKIKVNFVSEINNIINAALYVIDDDNVIDADGNIHISKIDGGKVETAMHKLSEINLFKVLVTVGVGVGAKAYLSEELTNSEIRELAASDFTGDIGRLLPYGTTSLTVGGHAVETGLDGAQGWYAYGPLAARVSQEVQLTTPYDVWSVLLTGFSEGFFISFH